MVHNSFMILMCTPTSILYETTRQLITITITLTLTLKRVLKVGPETLALIPYLHVAQEEGGVLI